MAEFNAVKIFGAVGIGLFLVQLFSVLANLIFGTQVVYTYAYMLLLVVVMAAFGAIMIVNMYTDADKATISAAYIKRHLFFLVIVIVAIVVIYVKFSTYIPCLFGNCQNTGAALASMVGLP